MADNGAMAATGEGGLIWSATCTRGSGPSLGVRDLVLCESGRSHERKGEGSEPLGGEERGAKSGGSDAGTLPSVECGLVVNQLDGGPRPVGVGVGRQADVLCCRGEGNESSEGGRIVMRTGKGRGLDEPWVMMECCEAASFPRNSAVSASPLTIAPSRRRRIPVHLQPAGRPFPYLCLTV
ncbi:hypothetical protein Ahy_B02g059437 isoform B [Arachis hypogaea]|uniref:Uncharacterized protein n=1 Tax=Arachis hypogaea TaxID=3818 RepID=A0A445AGQ6_ARAHY|nr:hypothetical protein Ahy_B02g059437 isoform B [Arachis hypogaea]